MNDPKVMRVPRSSAARAATPPGPTTSTTRCASCSPARPRAGTRSSTRSRCWPRPSGARTSTTATTRRSASGGSGRPRTTCRPSASSSSPPTTTRSATARWATGCRSQTRPLAAFCTLLSPFTPMLFQGEEYGERAPFQFFTDHIDPEIADATREGRRREFAAFAAFAGEEVPDPQDPADLRALQADPRGRARRACCDLHRELLRVRRELPGGRCRRRDLRRARRLARRPARRVHAAGELRPRDRACAPRAAPRNSC